MRQRMTVTAVLAVLGLALTLQARQEFADATGEWVVNGLTTYRFRVAGFRDRAEQTLPFTAASFEPTDDFSMEWADRSGITDVRLTGWYEQKRKNVREVSVFAPAFEASIRQQLACEGVAISCLQQDSAKLDGVLTTDILMEGRLKLVYTVVTTDGRKGKVHVTLEFTARRGGD